jgi:hypothetical protein
MPHLRSIGRVGLVCGLAALAVGVLLAGGSALLAGDWWLAPEPWIGVGLTLLVIGLAATAVFALLLDAVEPLGWLRLLAVPPALFIAFMWSIWLVFGVATTGPGTGPERDIRTILCSLPEMLFAVLIGTLLIALPLAAVRLRRSRTVVTESL